MTAKCSKCIEIFRKKRRRINLIQDIKAKSESVTHASLKNQACDIIRKLGEEKFTDLPISVETEVFVKDLGKKVDVVGHIADASIAVECGRTKPKKISDLEEHFDVVLHVPYCYTWNLFTLNIPKIEHKIFVTLVGKELERRNIASFEKGKAICLEKGECSLPSGRDGFPEEAMKMAGLLP